MQPLAFSEHQTIAYHTESGGWLFICQTCEYRALFAGSEQHSAHLEVLDIGNRHAVHINNAWPILDTVEDNPLEPEKLVNEQRWLTPELREQIYAIIARLE